VKKQLAIWAGVAMLGIGTVGSVGAQTVYAGPGLSDPALPPYEIMSIVRSTGLAPLTRPMRRGPYYVLVAVDRVGRQMRVVVDAQLGDIVNLRPALAVGSYGPEPGRLYGPPDTTGATAASGPRTGGEFYGTRPSADLPPPHQSQESALPPTPPRAVPNAGVTTPRTVTAPSVTTPGVTTPPPTRLAVAEPASPPAPPLPRPRPKLALNEAPATTPADAPAGPPAHKPAAPAATPSPAPSPADEAAKQIE
jgi:hypothetical protein